MKTKYNNQNHNNFKEANRHIAIMNVAYHANIKITEILEDEVKCICPFCNSRKAVPTASFRLKLKENKYYCIDCRKQGFSVDLYADIKQISYQKAFKELISKEILSENYNITKINYLHAPSNINHIDSVYRAFLEELYITEEHIKKLLELGISNEQIYKSNMKSVPLGNLKRVMIVSKLAKQFDLAGVPGFFMNPNNQWTFMTNNGIFIPHFDADNKISSLEILLDKPLKNGKDKILFTGNNRYAGTPVRQLPAFYNQSSLIKKNDIIPIINKFKSSTKVIISNDIISANIVASTYKYPTICTDAKLNHTFITQYLNKYNISNIIIVLKCKKGEKRKFKDDEIKFIYDLVREGYTFDIKYISDKKSINNNKFLKINNVSVNIA